MNDTTNGSSATGVLEPPMTGGYSDLHLGAVPTTRSLTLDGSPYGLGNGSTNVAPTPKPAMLEKAILLTVDLRGFGRTRKLPTDTVSADADKDLVRLSKQLLDAPELTKIDHYDTQIRAYVASKCLPSTVRRSVYILPLASIVEVYNKLEEFKMGRKALVEDFVAVYPQRIEQAEMRLREFFNPGDYPPQEQIRGLFSLSWQTISFGVPDVLAQINRDIFDLEKAKAQDQWHEAQEAIQNLLRVRLAGMVERLQERLTPNEEGKLKTFKASTVDNITAFLGDFEALNVTDDAKLAGIVEQARGLLRDVDAETLRKSKNIRETVLQGFENVQGQLEQLIVDKPSRGITFEDE